jgi:hypothetical protein
MLGFTLLILVSVSACTLNARTATPEASLVTPPAPGEGAVSPGVLTEVAATLYAPLAPTLTQQALQPPQAAIPTTPTVAAEQPQPTEPGLEPTAPAVPTAAPVMPTTAPAVPTAAPAMPTAAPAIPTEAPGPMLTSVVLPGLLTPTANLSGGFPPPATYVPAFPPGGYTAQTGQAVTIAGVNLPSCGSTFAANFLVINQSGAPFESASIQINDLSNGQVLATSIITNAPFMSDDRVCVPGGISRLESGYALFTGAALGGAGGLSRHTLQANLLFCSADGLGGRCFPRSVEFVVP